MTTSVICARLLSCASTEQAENAYVFFAAPTQTLFPAFCISVYLLHICLVVTLFGSQNVNQVEASPFSDTGACPETHCRGTSNKVLLQSDQKIAATIKMFMYRSVQDEALEWEIEISKDSHNLFFTPCKIAIHVTLQPSIHPSIGVMEPILAGTGRETG